MRDTENRGPMRIEEVERTCALPRPKTYFCIWRRRSRLSSRPMLNNRNTTPSSARCLTASTSFITPNACGPMRAPPACSQHSASVIAHYIQSRVNMLYYGPHVFIAGRRNVLQGTPSRIA